MIWSFFSFLSSTDLLASVIFILYCQPYKNQSNKYAYSIHKGVFLEGKCLSLPCPSSVVEAECIGVREALSWVMAQQGRRATIESDSLLTVNALNGRSVNLLEVGHIIDQCKMLLQGLPLIRVSHIRRQANRVAHSLARVPCSLFCSIVFTSPPTHLVETILDDCLI